MNPTFCTSSSLKLYDDLISILLEQGYTPLSEVPSELEHHSGVCFCGSAVITSSFEKGAINRSFVLCLACGDWEEVHKPY